MVKPLQEESARHLDIHVLTASLLKVSRFAQLVLQPEPPVVQLVPPQRTPSTLTQSTLYLVAQLFTPLELAQSNPDVVGTVAKAIDDVPEMVNAGSTTGGDGGQSLPVLLRQVHCELRWSLQPWQYVVP